MPVSWQDQINAARTEREVLHVARNFVATIEPIEIAQLPEPCRPPKLKDGNDLIEYAFDLVRHRCDDGLGADYAVHRLTAFFSGAAQRLAQILHTHSQNGTSDEQQSA